MLKRVLSVFLSVAIMFGVMCVGAVSAGAAGEKPRFYVWDAKGGALVSLNDKSAKNIDKWYVMYSKNADGDFKTSKSISKNTTKYTVSGLEYNTTYYFYVKTVTDGKTSKSEAVKYTTPSFDNVKISVYNHRNGSVSVYWNSALVPDKVSVYYCETPNGSYKGFKNVKGEIGDYNTIYYLKNLDFNKKYYIKAVFNYKGKNYVSNIEEIVTAAKPELTTKKSEITEIVKKAVTEEENVFSVYYKTESLAMSGDDMIKKYKCFADVETITQKKNDGTVYISYTVKYKNYPNILFAYATGETSHLSKEAKKNYTALKKIIKSETSEKNTDKENIKAIHDYLVNNTDYDMKNYKKGTIPESSYRITGILQHGVSVCNGYMENFQLLMDMLGINCISVSGKANNGSGNGYQKHAWNMVEIDNKWYWIDVTWDDPSNVKMLRYDYYLLTDKQMKTDHKWDLKGLPVCDGKTTYTDKKNKAFVAKFAEEFVYYDTDNYLYQGKYF